MAPNSRIVLTRHAQAEHNVDLDYSIPDAPLTPLGEKQAATLAPQLRELQQEVELVASSPLKRTLQTTMLGWGPAVQRLGIENVVILPQAQECNDHPCDTGSSREELEADPQLAGFNLSSLPPDWTSKRGFWSPEPKAIANRARWVRQWLRERSEEHIVLVAHGDILRNICAGPDGPSIYPWKNGETRIFHFDPESVKTHDCFLDQEKVVAAVGGYAPTSTDIDLVHIEEETNGV